jgi:hypothetical protein
VHKGGTKQYSFLQGFGGESIEVFDNTIKLEIKEESQDMDVDDTPDTTDLPHREACFMLFDKFTKEV